ncbi:MAG: DNA repair protein RadA [Candidatus Eisenbacteria bacterium]|uniref:DNA repair protein RadA n=1 Tax=Eiseniibacteriota bacterium TaxID=2212470 RepID=A0A948S0J3_UNCEI|nr:DNA repair protein RadA [Candidatus Eisenbacteria bacterium]MBU1948311.1 DNA repair protein RadA [Candidatus Eisenbacteria bacterium]MBU2693103.1 DNA repair protein RadA [Candidatus Eisenbacteria bacterium]
MAKSKSNREVYLCGDCGDTFVQWYGRCPSCGTWNTLKSYRPPEAVEESGGGAGLALARAHGADTGTSRPLNQIGTSDWTRLATGVHEFDRVVGGGLVPGSTVLLGGEPGVGKSTLLLQVAGALVQRKIAVLYVSAEESPEQIRLRADRMRGDMGPILLMAENAVDRILREAERTKPGVLIIDSIQTVFLSQIASAPGSLVQVRESAMALTRWAKQHDVPVLLVGHVTKEGTLAGPKTLEHMVDTVLDMTGDPNRGYRLLQAAKNRFGSVQELGVFDMRDDGLIEVDQPSKLLLRPGASMSSGSVVVPTMEGSRALLVEVQALTHAVAYSNPQRVATGFDTRRLAILLGVLEKWARLRFSQNDVFLNVAGGLKITEPASDLGVVMALAGSRTAACVGEGRIVFGEVGLGGEVRRVRHARRRLEEALASGYTEAILPRVCLEEVTEGKNPPKMKLLPVGRVDEAVRLLKRVPAEMEIIETLDYPANPVQAKRER